MVMNMKEPEKINAEEEDFESTNIDDLCDELDSLSF